MNQNSKVQSDISQAQALHPAVIEEVGLNNIELPLKIPFNGKEEQVQACVSILVSLDQPHVRGIHMSRLYLTLHEFSKNHTLTLKNLMDLLDQCIQSQQGSSSTGRVHVSWKSSIKKQALKSSYEGWQTYPCFFEVIKKSINHLQTKKLVREFFMGATLLYSSTCPCSAALSRELIQKNFKEEHEEWDQEKFHQWLGQESSHVALPHSQKSEAQIKVQVEAQNGEKLQDMILSVEKALATPVQVAVKREDEQEFARLNAHNLMYTEDAIRKIKHQLESDTSILDYHVQVRHIESLHPFDTLAVSRKRDQ